MSDDPLQAFLDNQGSSRIVEIAHSGGLIDDDRRDAIYLALLDITQSLATVYRNIIPQLLGDNAYSEEQIWELFFDLRDEFRHIDYHIHDAELDALEWPKPK